MRTCNHHVLSCTEPCCPVCRWLQVFRRAAASVVTLGSGASLGPEAPSVELGANTAAVLAPKHLSKRRQRMLVAAGAAAGRFLKATGSVVWGVAGCRLCFAATFAECACGRDTLAVSMCHVMSAVVPPPLLLLCVCAGVSAAFDAPATGALFAIEFVLKSSRLGLDRLSTSTVFAATSVSAGVVGFLRGQGQALGITGAATHLVGRIPYFSVNPNLLTDVLQVGWGTRVVGRGAGG